MVRASSWRFCTPCLALAGLLVVMGVVGPAPTADPARTSQLVAREIGRLRVAVERYVDDVGEAPQSVADLSGGFCGGLRDPRFARSAHRERWQGPYLTAPCARPTPTKGNGGRRTTPAVRPPHTCSTVGQHT